MPSNYTSNYHLNQWEPEDAVRRVDFNADNLAIDEALTGLAGTLSQHTVSMTKLGDCKLYTATYGGSGTVGSAGARTLNFPSKPYLVVICGQGSFMVLVNGTTLGLVVYLSAHYTNNVSWGANSVSWYCSSRPAEMLNTVGESYRVLALLKAGE